MKTIKISRTIYPGIVLIKRKITPIPLLKIQKFWEKNGTFNKELYKMISDSRTC